MIDVKFHADDDGTYHMTMRGHAMTAPKGGDMVCAGASTLAYTLAQVVSFQAREEELAEPPLIKLEDGDAEVVAKPLPSSAAETLHSFFVIQAGMHLLSANYPKAVKLTPFGKVE